MPTPDVVHECLAWGTSKTTLVDWVKAAHREVQCPWAVLCWRDARNYRSNKSQIVSSFLRDE